MAEIMLKIGDEAGDECFGAHALRLVGNAAGTVDITLKG